jgi:hypothetical protein
MLFTVMALLVACHCFRACRMHQRLDAATALAGGGLPSGSGGVRAYMDNRAHINKRATPDEVIVALPVLPYGAVRDAARAGGGEGGEGGSGGGGDDQAASQQPQAQAPKKEGARGSSGSSSSDDAAARDANRASGAGSSSSGTSNARDAGGSSGGRAGHVEDDQEACAVCYEEFSDTVEIKQLPCGRCRLTALRSFLSPSVWSRLSRSPPSTSPTHTFPRTSPLPNPHPPPPSGHFFHIECVNRWLRLDHVCPVCRGRVYAAPDDPKTPDNTAASSPTRRAAPNRPAAGNNPAPPIWPPHTWWALAPEHEVMPVLRPFRSVVLEVVVVTLGLGGMQQRVRAARAARGEARRQAQAARRLGGGSGRAAGGDVEVVAAGGQAAAGTSATTLAAAQPAAAAAAAGSSTTSEITVVVEPAADASHPPAAR